MLKKIHWVMINIVTFILILMLLFLPLLNVKTVNGDAVHKTLYGFHLLSGFSILNESGMRVQVLTSKLVGFVPIMMLLSLFIINKVSKAATGKYLVNFLCLAVTLVCIALLPVIAPTFAGPLYINELEFTKYWGYYVSCIVLAIVLGYYTFILVKTLIKISKEEKEKENK